MERPQKQELGGTEFTRVKVFVYLLTPNSDEMNNVNNKRIKNKAKQDDNMIISALSVKFTDMPSNMKEPSDNIQNIVQKEIQESISDNIDFVRTVSICTPSDVRNVKPEGEPETKEVQIAEYVISPNEEGIIGVVDFKPFEKLFA